MFDSTIITAIIAALVALYGYYYTQSSMKQRDINEAHRNHKIDVYKQIMSIYSEILLNTSQKKTQVLPVDVDKRMVQFTTELINWGSPNTIIAFSKMRHLSEDNKDDILSYWDYLLFEIRKDLGLSNKGLVKGDLVKLYLSDPEIFDQHYTAVENPA